MKTKNVNAQRGASQAATPSKDAGASVSVPSEWGTVADVEARYRIRKGSLYNLLKNGRVQSVVVPCTGTKRGLRRVYLPSVEKFLAELLKEQAATQS